MPLHGASSSTRSNVPMSTGRSRPSATTHDHVREVQAGGRFFDEARRARRRRRRRPPHRRRPLARRSRWPCRRGQRRDRRCARPVAGRATATTAWLPWSCGVARPSRTAGSRAGSPMPRTTSDALDEPARLDLAARRARSRCRPRSGCRGAGSPASVTAAGSFIATSAAWARSAPSSAVRRSTSQSGYESAIASLDRLRVRRPEAGDAAEHAVGEPTRARRAGHERLHRLAHGRVRGNTLHELVRAHAQRGAHRRVEPPDRSRRRALDEIVEHDVARARSRRRDRWRTRGRGRRAWCRATSWAARRARTRLRRCAPSASSATSRAVLTCRARTGLPRRPRTHSSNDMSARPSGCTSSGTSAPSSSIVRRQDLECASRRRWSTRPAADCRRGSRAGALPPGATSRARTRRR